MIQRTKDPTYTQFINCAKSLTVIAAIFAVITLVCPAEAQIAKRIPDQDLNINLIKVIKGQIWVGTDSGAYVLVDNVPHRVSDMSLNVIAIEEVKGQVWLGTDQGAYQFHESTLRRIPDIDLVINSIKEINEEIWLATDIGAFVINGDSHRRITQEDTQITDMAEIDGQVWLATGQGVYRVDKHTPRLIEVEIKLSPTSSELLIVNGIKKIKDQIWLATNRGVYRIVGDKPKPVSILHRDVTHIEEYNGRIWLATDGGAFSLEGGIPRRVPDLDLEIESIKQIKGQTWLATNNGAYRIEEGAPTRFPDLDLAVKDIADINGRIWLATEQGAYRIDEDTEQRIPDINLNVHSVVVAKGKVWLATENGAYRIDEDHSVSVTLKPVDSGWLHFAQSVLPQGIWISGLFIPEASYIDADGRDPYGEQLNQHYEVIWEADQERFNYALAGERYNAAERALLQLTSGKHTIHYSVRDKWGNTFRSQISALVVPGPAALAFLAASLWISLLLIALLFAPVSTFCHSLVMNPFLRRYGSFGVVPLLITALPFVRRHVLRRYLRSLRRDVIINEWQQRFVLPTDDFLPEHFSELLDSRRTLLLVGQSGIGKTSYFRYLTGCYASKKRKRLMPSDMIPVILPLSRYEGVHSEDIFYAELSNYGKLTDKDLNTWFLQQGGFLVFIDGLNEVPDATRKGVSRFVNQNWKANYFCISSQQAYADFEWMEKVELSYLSPEKIKEILRKRLGKQAEGVVKEFNESTYEVYQIPQDLEFAIELLKKGQPLPKSKRDIYKATLDPLFESWESAGQAVYPPLLFKRAYEMLCSGDAFFERKEAPIPDEIRESLRTRRFIIRRGDHYQFRHDLVRAYLAARHFTPRWEDLMQKGEVNVDSNWRAMLEFAILDIDQSEQVGKLLTAVLEKNTRLAGEIFKWINRFYPDLCGSWTSEFMRRYGEALLK